MTQVKRIVEKGKTLLVDGPASVNALSGEVEVFGVMLKTGVQMVIREGKRIPFEVKTKAEFDLTAGEKAFVNEVEGSTIPVSWRKAVDEVLDREKPVTVMVVGGADSGKTSFCAYLTNRALKKNLGVALVDADLGQSDLGPPSTIGYCRLTRPVTDLFEVEASNVCFIGVTSPSGSESKIIEGIMSIKENPLKESVDVLIINTDGWVEGEEAIRYKVALAKSIKPNLLIGIQEKGELTFLLGALTNTQKLVVETPPAIRKRDQEDRRLLRELGYKKYLKGARAEIFPLSWVMVDDFRFGTGAPPSWQHVKEIEQTFVATHVYCEETPNFLFVALRKKQRGSEKHAKDLGQKLNKKVVIMREDDEKGLIVALHDTKDNFLGVGVLESIDYERRIIRVYTPVHEGVASLHVGRVKLDKKGREIGLTDIFDNHFLQCVESH